MLRNLLLVCGILSSLVYIALNIFVPPLFEGYNWISQTVSELSAVEAPTRPLWVPWGHIYTLLTAAFGWGVLQSSDGNRHLRIAGGLLVFYGIFGLFWPPMHLRGHEMTLTDTMHIVFAMVTIGLMMLIIGYGAAGMGKGFRIFSLVTIAVFIVFGTLTGLEAPGIATNTPTPYIGLWERINIAMYMLWVMVLAVVLLRSKSNSKLRLEEQRVMQRV